MPLKAEAKVHEASGVPHLRWIMRFQIVLLPLGIFAWAMKSMASSAFFLAGGLLSLLLWRIHTRTVGLLLPPSKKRRWAYVFLGVLKLALIMILLRVIMKYFPMEALPFAAGLLLYVVAILLEAARLLIRHVRSAIDVGSQL